jgi:glycosyltransferase involved in cell wall biosynthesis
MTVALDAYHLTREPGIARDGTHRYAVGLFDQLFSLDDSVEFHLWVRDEFDVPETWMRDNVRVFTIPGCNRTWWHTVRFRSEAKRRAADVLFNINGAAPVHGGVKRLSMVHDVIPFLYPEFFDQRRLHALKLTIGIACRRAEGLVVNSEATASDVRRLFGRTKPIWVTPLATDLGALRREASSVCDDELDTLGVRAKRYILNVGGINPRKNLVGLVRAFAEVAGRPEHADLALVVAGPKGWKDDAVYQAVAELRLGGRVHFIGFVDDARIAALMARCECFAYPSHYEGFGLPILEAFALGARVVTSATSSMPEVGGDVATYADPSDPGSIAQALAETLTEPSDSRRERIAQGLERARAFTWRRTAEATLLALKELHAR